MTVSESMPKFAPGRLVATPGALEALERNGQGFLEFLARHVRGDWGDVDTDDRRANDADLTIGGRLLSAYMLKDGTRIWIITEAVGDNDTRESTCILLPEEY